MDLGAHRCFESFGLSRAGSRRAQMVGGAIATELDRLAAAWRLCAASATWGVQVDCLRLAEYQNELLCWPGFDRVCFDIIRCPSGAVVIDQELPSQRALELDWLTAEHRAGHWFFVGPFAGSVAKFEWLLSREALSLRRCGCDE